MSPPMNGPTTPIVEVATPTLVSAIRAAIPRAGDSPSYWWRQTVVAAILDLQEQENAGRPDFTPAISRAMVEGAINALFGIYDCRPSDTAAAYAWTGLWDTLRLDWRHLKFVPEQEAGESSQVPGPISNERGDEM